MTQVLPSKLVDERILVIFDFLDLLAWGEVLESASVEVQVQVGVDSLPQEMLYKVPVIVSGRYVQQQIQAGVPGVLYQVKCHAFTTLGVEYEKYVRLAILPDDARTPLFIADYLTSRPYPVEDIEGFTTTFLPDDGRLINQKVVELPEGIRAYFVPLTGTLVGGEVSYGGNVEELSTSFEPLSGDLYGSIVSFEAPDEGFVTDFLPLGGTLVGGRVFYGNEVEGLTTSFTPLSGTLA